MRLEVDAAAQLCYKRGESEKSMRTENLFPHQWRQVCELDERRRAAWAELTSPEAIRRRQRWVRETVQEMIGPFPDRCDLAAETTGRLTRDDARLEKVIFWSRPGFPVTATLYLPPTGDGPFPAVISPCGHSATGRREPNYQRAHLALVRQGFVVLSYDPVSQGERDQYLDDTGQPRIPNCCEQHCLAGNQLELVGGSMANIRIWDGIRALDYLLTRPEVDGRRVAVTGNSGGGTLSTFLLCLDERYAAGAPSCYITTLVDRIATRSAADSEQQFSPMLAHGIDHADLLLPLAPNPLLICAAIKDFFPIAGARRTAEDLRAIYEVFGAAGKVDICEGDHGHGFHPPLREGMTRWFKQHLRGVDEPYQEPDIEIEAEEDLYATATGQVMTSELGALGIHEIVTRDFPIKLACRATVDPGAAVRAKLPELLGIDPARAKHLWPRPYWRLEKPTPPPAPAGVRLEKVRLLSDFDVDLHGTLHHPAGGGERAVLLLPDDVGRAMYLGRDSRANQLAAAGVTVLTIDPRGMGEDLGELPDWCPPERYHHFYGIEVEQTYTSWMIGRPLLGQRVFDALCAVEWLHRRGCSVELEGDGYGAVLALLATALEPTIGAVTCRGMLVSWRNLFETDRYAYLPNVLVPRALCELDLPDIAAAIAPRPVTIAAPLDARRQPVGEAALTAEYEPALRAYRSAAGDLKLVGSGAELERAVGEPVPAD